MYEKCPIYFLRLVWIPRKKSGDPDEDVEDLPDDEVNEIDSTKIDEEIENLVSSDEDDNDVAWVQGDALGQANVGPNLLHFLYTC